METMLPQKYRAVITKITSSGIQASAELELNSGKTRVVVRFPSAVQEVLGIREKTGAGLLIIRPLPGFFYNTGETVATVRNADNTVWVSIPFGPEPVPEHSATPPPGLSGDGLARFYGYRTLDAFREATAGAFTNNRCAGGTAVLGIETVLEHRVWYTFRTGTLCEAQKRNLTADSNSARQTEALIHGYPSEGEYTEVKSQAFADNVPVLAGFAYYGDKDRPDIFTPAGNSLGKQISPIPVFCYKETRLLCQTEVTGVRQSASF